MSIIIRAVSVSLPVSMVLLVIFELTVGCVPHNIDQGSVREQRDDVATTAIITGVTIPTVVPNTAIAACSTITSVPALPATVTTENISSATAVGCVKVHGRIEKRAIASKYQPNDVNVEIYLPPCYQKGVGELYPVIYLLHGQSFDEDQWERLGVGEIADTLISGGAVQPFMIVMPKETDYLKDPNDSDFDRILVDELIPWIEVEYDVCREFDCRAIGGISRGAAWAMRIGLKECGLFSAVGAHSLPPFRGDITSLQYWLMNCSKDQRPRLYLDIGSYDRYLEAANQFQAALITYRMPHEWHLNEGSHNEDYWRSHTRDYIEWYISPWN